MITQIHIKYSFLCHPNSYKFTKTLERIMSDFSNILCPSEEKHQKKKKKTVLERDLTYSVFLLLYLIISFSTKINVSCLSVSFIHFFTGFNIPLLSYLITSSLIPLMYSLFSKISTDLVIFKHFLILLRYAFLFLI